MLRKRRGTAAAGVIGLTALTTAPAAAQLVTDRPDFVESSTTVGTGIVQLETSVAMDHEGEVDAWSTPTLLRVGFADDWEVRLETAGYLRVGDPSDLSGLGDAAIGVKWHVSDGGENRPTTALLLHADLPVGSDDFRQDGIRPSLRGVAEWELSALLSFGAMAGVRSDRAGPDRFTSGILAGVLGWGWRDTFRTYTEVALAQIAADEHGGTVAAANIGATLLLDDDTQLDGGISFPISDSASDFAFTIGFSRRFGR